MKRFASIIPLFTIIITIIFSGTTCFAIDLNAKTGFNYDWWESDDNDQGSQFYVPLQIKGEYNEFSFLMLNAYTYTNSDPSDAEDISLSSIIDTKLNLSYEMVDKLPVNILFGLDFNLPTGHTNLDEDDQELIMDPDLVSITNFGEGFNVNPTITAVKEWTKWAAGLGVGYLWRGEYDFNQETKDYDPGEVLSLTGEVDYDFLPDWRARLFGEYAHHTKDQVDGEDFFQEGDFLLAGLGVHYYQATWDVSATVKSIFRDKNKFQEGSHGIDTEDKSSYGDELVVDLFYRYLLNDETTIKTLFQFLHVKENDYPSDSTYFIGKRQKISLGLGVVRTLGSHFEGELGIKGYILDADRNWYHEDDLTYKGFSIGGKLTYRF